MQWTDGGGGTHNVPLAAVEVVEHDLLSSSVIATGQTDLAGNYTINVTHDDGVLQGDPDITVRILPRSPVADVKAPDGSAYLLESAQQDEIAEGTTFTFSPVAGNTADNDTAFSVHHALVVSGQYAGNLAGVTPSQIDVKFGTTSGTSFFRSSDPSLTILKADRFDWDVVHHEYGHYFMNIHGIENNPGGSHSFGANLSSSRGSEAVGLPLAWGEGWPTFFGIAGQQSTGAAGLGVPNVGDTGYQDTDDATISIDLESRTGVGEDNEVSVMAAMWDAFDSTSSGEMDTVTISDRVLFNAVKGAGATTVGAAWDAIANPLSNLDRTRLGEVFGHNKISPSLTAPADNAAMGASPLTFTWNKNGGGATNPLNDFRIRFYKSDLNSIVFQKDLGDVNTYTPTMAEWDMIRAEPTIKWVVEGRNTTGVATPGGTLGYYWSGARTLGGASIALVIDDTGSMSQEIAGVRTALQLYIDAIAGGLAPGADAPTIELITFKDSVTTRIASNDLTAVRSAVGALRASGGGDCPEFSAHALATAVQSVGPGGTIVLATDAAPQPGVDIGAVTAEMRAKGITLYTILTGDCTGISSSRTAEAIPDAIEMKLVVEPSAHAIDLAEFMPGSRSDEVIADATPTSPSSVPGVTSGVVMKPTEDGDDHEDDTSTRVQISDAGQPAIDDHANTTMGATKLTVGGPTLLGTVGLGSDSADFFSVDLAAGTRRTVKITEAGSVRVEVLAPDGTSVLASRSVFNTGNVVVDVSATGTHFVKVTNNGSGTDAYSIAVTDDPFAGLTSAVDVFSAVSAQTGGSFLVRDGINAGSPEAFVASIFNVLASTLGATVIAASPNDVPQGETIEVAIEGRGTNWRPGDTTVMFSNGGIQVTGVEVTSPTTLNARISVQAGTPLGTYDVAVSTALGATTETANGLNVLEITPATTSPRLLAVAPGNLVAGTGATVTLFGANVTWDSTSTVTLGPDVSVDTVRVIGPKELEVDVTVNTLADIGFRTATVTTSGQGSVSLSRAVFVDVAVEGLPQVSDVAPGLSGVGVERTLIVTGLNTSFVDGVTTATLGAGVEVLEVTVNSDTEASVKIRVAPDAAPGFRNVALNTNGEFAVLIGGFFVEGVGATPNPSSPAIDILNIDGREVVGVDAVTLIATASDVEDGDISDRISWSSSRDGGLGVGATIESPLSAGIHTITARVSDSGGLTGFDSINVFVPQSQVGVAIEGSIWDTPPVAIDDGDIVSSTTANRLLVSYASTPEQPPTLELNATSGGPAPVFLLSFWDGKTGVFESFSPLPTGSYTAELTVPGSTRTIGFSVEEGTSNSVVSPDGADNIFAGVVPSGPQRLLGDANGDNSVDFGDFSIFAANFGKTDAVFADGDFDGDGLVGFGDFSILAANIGARI